VAPPRSSSIGAWLFTWQHATQTPGLPKHKVPGPDAVFISAIGRAWATQAHNTVPEEWRCRLGIRLVGYWRPDSSSCDHPAPASDGNTSNPFPRSMASQKQLVVAPGEPSSTESRTTRPTRRRWIAGTRFAVLPGIPPPVDR
jgi:hypothetical protein